MQEVRLLGPVERVPRARRSRWTVAALLTALVVFFALEAWRALTPAPSLVAGPRVVEIPPRSGLREIAKTLDEENVIRSQTAFALLAGLRGTMRSLRAGEYLFPQGANTLAVLAMLETGQVRQHSVVFREGATLLELADEFAAEKLAHPDEVLRVARDPAFLRAHGVHGGSAEGYLFPDTYHFVRGMAIDDMLGRMIGRMRERVSADVLAAADARHLSLHQLLTLASIIEKEAVDPEEMPLISAVFWNRMKLDMPLQADPTVQYAVGKERQRLTHDDLLVDSPFNTYRQAGLPPGPIASPSLAAIRAALNPAPVNYLYFVATNDRQHRFSSTLADHNAAVARYRVTRVR